MSHYLIHCHRKATYFLRYGGDVVNATLSPDIMFITNKHHRYHELFQTVKPYRGEPPTLAGKDLLAPVLFFSVI